MLHRRLFFPQQENKDPKIPKIFFKSVSSNKILPFFQRGLLERLDAGEVVVGDGGFVFALEKRGYVKAGPWTPEAVREYPEAGKLKFSDANKKTNQPGAV